MKNLESQIFNMINSVFAFIQSKTDLLIKYPKNLIDIIILFFVLLTFIVSTFATSNIIGIISFFVPLLVFLKVLTVKGEKIELERCNFYLLIYLLICLISNFTSSMLTESFYGFMKTLIYFAFYFALCQFLKNNKKFIKIILFVIAGVISFESIVAILQSTMHLENIATWQDVSYLNPEDVLSRVYGTLKPYNPNLLGGYLISGLASILAVATLFFTNKNYKTALLSLGLFFVSLLAVFQTGCRGAYLALFVVVIGIILASYNIVFCTLKNEKYKKIWNKLIVLTGGLSILFMVLNHKIFYRIMSIFILRGDSSTSFRMNVYNSAIQMFQDNWLYGIGVGNKVFREIYGLYMLSGFDALSCYCIFLEMAVESGILSLIIYMLFVVSLLKAGITKFIRSNDIQYKIILFVCIISIFAVLVHGIFDTIYFRPQVQYIYWTMAAILVVLTKED